MKFFGKFFLISLIFFILSIILAIQCDPIPGFPVLSPFGKGKGIFPGRVVWNWNKNATSWDGVSDFYWNSNFTDYKIVETMLNDAILKLTGENSIFNAWDSLFRFHNIRHTGSNVPYKKGEKIAIKINLNGEFDGYKDNNGNEVTPQFLKGLLKQLVDIYKVDEDDIYFYDASRYIVPKFINNVKYYYPKTHWQDNKGQYPVPGVVEKIEADFKNNEIHFSSQKVPAATAGAFIPTIVSNAKYLIVIDNFRGHDMAGFTATGKNFFGSFYDNSVDCDFDFFAPHHWCPANLHDFANVTLNPMGSYNPIVDFLGHPKLGLNALLFMVDGLYGGQSENQILPNKFQMQPFNNWWTSSIFMSQDSIALDSVLFDFIRNEPTIPFGRVGCVDNYLHESSLANNPPSKTIYAPDGKNQLDSLGVHEHWNNAIDKNYSINLGKENGIELVKISPIK